MPRPGVPSTAVPGVLLNSETHSLPRAGGDSLDKTIHVKIGRPASTVPPIL
jgi:hypothetical protein